MKISFSKSILANVRRGEDDGSHLRIKRPVQIPQMMMEISMVASLMVIMELVLFGVTSRQEKMMV